MDPVTHFLSGACLSRAGFNRTTGLATLTLVLASETPDLDVVTLFGGSVSYLQHHRGITHTLIGVAQNLVHDRPIYSFRVGSDFFQQTLLSQSVL